MSASIPAIPDSKMSTSVLTVTERLAQTPGLTEYQKVATQIILEGIAFAKSDAKDDPTGAHDYFQQCLRATFNFGESKEERLRAKYTLAILLFSHPMNRNMLVKMMVDEHVLSEMIVHLGDAGGEKAKIQKNLRVKAQFAVNVIVEQIDTHLKTLRAAGEPMPMDDLSDDSDNSDNSDNSDDDIINSMLAWGITE